MPLSFKDYLIQKALVKDKMCLPPPKPLNLTRRGGMGAPDLLTNEDRKSLMVHFDSFSEKLDISQNRVLE